MPWLKIGIFARALKDREENWGEPIFENYLSEETYTDMIWAFSPSKESYIHILEDHYDVALEQHEYSEVVVTKEWLEAILSKLEASS